MVGKILKNGIIVLLTIILAMLLFAVVLYEYIPSKKEIPTIKEYVASDQVSSQLADSVDQEKQQVVLTYEVTSTDLNNYKVTNEYIPGKANPFAPVSEDPEQNAITPGNIIDGGNNISDGNTIDSGNNTIIEQSLIF